MEYESDRLFEAWPDDALRVISLRHPGRPLFYCAGARLLARDP